MKKMILALLCAWVLILFSAPMAASAGVVLKLGDILVAEPGAEGISVINPSTGAKTLISQGGLLSPSHKVVGVAFAPDGDVIAVHRMTGLIRVSPITGSQIILSQGGLFKDPWAIAIDNVTGYIYVADSGYDNDRPAINEAGKIVRVHPVSGAQELIAVGSPCNAFPPNAACQNTTSAGSYLAHPYGIAIDYSTAPATLIVADMSSFNGKGAIIRIEAVPNGTQTLVWGPATASPPPQIAQSSPLGCPMGVAVAPNGNILTTVFTFPVPPTPTVPPPAGTFYGCAAPGIFRLDLTTNVQAVVNTNAPTWQPSHAYAVGDVIKDPALQRVHRVVTAGLSGNVTPSWTAGTTFDGSVVWQNIGLGADWLIPFGLGVEPAPTPSDPLHYNVLVPDEGYSMVFRLDAEGHFLAAPLTAGVSTVTSVHVITVSPPDPPPARFNGHPAGVLSAGTTQTTMGLTTDEAATCRYSAQPFVAYASMTNTFSTTGSTNHSTVLSGLLNNQSYWFYVRCADAAGNANTNDFVIAFSVGSSSATTSNFLGTESPLSEGGIWDSPGGWADLQKDNGGAHAIGVNAMGRLVTPAVAADQYAEITYDQDPGSSSWVGVATRIQGALNGSGYLAIVFRGEVQLYRTDDSGGLNFTLLASASAATGSAPRRLRLESQGNTHRVYFNGALLISHDATGTIYASGQPGIAASVFGGPQVKIISFEGGNFGAIDVVPPLRSNGFPVGTLPAGTTQTTMGLTTDEASTCRYTTQPGVAYASMTNAFTTTGATAHSTVLSNLINNQSYWFYVRCADAAGNANTSDFLIAFSVGNTVAAISNFAGTESVLSEGGMWDSPGGWNDLQKDNGAYAIGLNAMARLVTPPVAADQYAEITYNQDPGLEGTTWVGVATRIHATNGTNYLAIVYAGEVRLYRTDNSSGLKFTLLASASAATGTAPRKLRLESQGNIHRVYFNGALMFSHTATGTIYATGQPGIGASVLQPGGPQVKILSFEGGSLGASVDTTPPETTITGRPAEVTNATSATFTFTSNEVGSTFQCRLDAAAFAACTSPRTLTSLAAGSHTFEVRATDASGNVDPSPASATWVIELTAPDTTINSGPPSSTNSTSATFTFSSTEAGTFECQLDNAAFTACPTPQTYNGLASGTHTFRVRAKDVAGNVDGSPAVYTWSIDTSAPNTTITGNPTTPSTSTSATFAFTSNQTNSTFQCSLDGAAFALCASPVTYTNLTHGGHNFQVRAIDPAGNADPTPASFSWTVDIVVPDTTILSGPPSLTNSTSASFTFSSTEAGATFQCSLDGAAFTNCSSPKNYTGLLEGLHSFQVRARDAAGNVDQTPSSYAWTVDRTAPSVTIVSGPPTATNVTTATFTVTSNDPAARFECRLDGAAFAPCVSPVSYAGLATGSHTFRVRAIDVAGNVGATALQTWSIDTTPPNTTITANPATVTSSSTATFTFTANQAGSVFACSLDGAAFTLCTTPATYTGLTAGSHSFQVRATDPAGNTDPTPAAFGWTIQ